MKKRFRLARQRDFQSVLSGSRLYSGQTVVGFASASGLPKTRIGIAVSKRLKGGVDRNRAKRRLREAARLVLLGLDSEAGERGIGYDVVLIARPAALTVPFPVLEREAAAFLARLRGLRR